MSTEQPLDPHLIEQTKQQIRSLVSEIAQLAKSDISPDEFYSEYLNRVVSALAAVGGVVWTLNEEKQLALQYQINLQETGLRESEEAQGQHNRLLYKVLNDGEGILVPPHSGADEDDDQRGGNLTDYLLVFGPLKTDVETVGVVEIFQRADAGPNTQKGYLRFLMQMCELAGDYLKSHQLRHYSDRQSLWAQLEDFTSVIHRSLNPRETAYVIANEGRRLIECDRLSVAIMKGRKCVIEAISGQDVFDKRSNLVRLLNRLATAVVATGESVWYTGDTRDFPPQVEDAVQEYVDESHSKSVAIIPLHRPELEDAEDENDEKGKKKKPPIAALIVEQIEDSRVPHSMIQRVDVVNRHSASALTNALEHQNLFLMPVWREIGKARWVLSARTLPKTISITLVILAAILFLSFFPAKLELEGKGTLEPVTQREVFAGIDGVVQSLEVNHGDHVVKGQLLATLRNTALEVEIAKTLGDRQSNAQRMNSIQLSMTRESKLRPEERDRMAAERAELQEKEDSLAAQLALLKYKQQELSILSPIDGMVVTWDLKDHLIHRPVQRGQVLMRVVDPTEDWQLELHMPENRMGYITTAQKEMKTDDLEVTYILATEPGHKHEGTVKEIHGSAEVMGEEGNTVLIKVKINKDELPDLRPGATVTAKVYCGKRSLGFVIFHDVLAFLQSRIFFRYF